VNGQGAATSTGIFPAQAEPAEAEHGADHASARERDFGQAASLLTQRFDPLPPREEARRKAPLAPEDQVNHLAERRFPLIAR